MRRLLLLPLALPLLALGAWGLGEHFAPNHALLAPLDALVRGVFKAAGQGDKAKLLVGVVPGGVVALAGLFLLLKIVKKREGEGEAPPAAGSGEPGEVKLSAAAVRKAGKRAAALAKQGDVVGAGDLCLETGLHDQAVKYFVQAQDFGRAADVRQAQHRYEEAADFLVQAGRFDTAGSLFASRSQWEKAADCYRKSGRMSVAAEMYEKAERWELAGECYMRCEFHRHAAQAFLKIQSWKKAAAALEKAIEDETGQALAGDREKAKEVRKLVLQTAKLYEQSSDMPAALRVLTAGECWGAAAEVAERTGMFEKAAELYQRAGNAPKAAEALRQLGDDRAAAQLLGEHLREKGQEEEAVKLLLEAGDLGAAGELYRKLEDWQQAGECFERAGDGMRAAEMFRLADDWERAAGSYAKVQHFQEAAECVAQLGDAKREAGFLAQAGQTLAAAKVLLKAEREEEAIKLLQSVAPEASDFRSACAVLGEVFRRKGKHQLAQKKLEQAIGGAAPAPANVELYYHLALVHDGASQAAAAVAIYEKILEVDYHYRDVEERIELARSKVQSGPAAEGEGAAESTSRPRGGRYRIDNELGRGGMGIVYRAHDVVLDRPVALKVLPDALRDSPDALKNFLREAKAAAKLNHPNIVMVYDAGEQDGRYYIAMEYVDGTTLKDIVRKKGAIAPRPVAHIAIQMCEALAYAHAQKVVHRDVKTANTMWTKDKKAKIMDFGLAKVVEEVLNHTTLVSGTPYYMSPEQTLGKNVDYRTDLYSLGVTLFEMATGQLPFREGNVPYHHVHTPPPDPAALKPDLPPPLAEVILHCLQKDPAARPQSAQEIIPALRPLIAKA